MIHPRVLVLALAGCACAQLQAQRGGVGDSAYAVSALGASAAMQDCGHHQACPAYDALAGKLGVGVRVGGVATELWGLEFGRDKPAAGLSPQRLQAVALMAAWTLPFTGQVHGVLRAGGGTLTQTQPDGTRRLVLAVAYGGALVLHAALWLALELGWDMVTADGEGSRAVLGQMGTAGVRLSF